VSGPEDAASACAGTLRANTKGMTCHAWEQDAASVCAYTMIKQSGDAVAGPEDEASVCGYIMSNLSGRPDRRQ